MNLNDVHEMAGRKYEKHLSGFGQKVLKVLVQQNTKDDLLKYRKRFNISNTRSYIESSHFESPNLRYSNPDHFPISNSENNVVDFVNDNSSNECLDLQNKVDVTVPNIVSFETAVPKTNELIKSVLLSPQAHQSTHLNSLNSDMTQVPPASSLFNTINDQANLRDSRTLDNAEEVPWDDIFDTELLAEIISNENDTCKNNTKASQIFETEFRNEALVNKKNETCGTKISKKRVKKRRVDNKEVSPKKVKKFKKAPEDKEVKPNFRKQKYSKAVKNWLNDVDPANVIDDTEVVNDATIRANENDTLEKSVAKETEKSKPKKTVQAQLSNNNGIMKYSKPKDVKEISNVEKRESIIDSINKVKSFKSKFIPPIKSQIPVKELIYEIETLQNDSSNCLSLFEHNDQEIVLTVIYRNGFCQLNNQHTEDVGNVEGIMFLANDKYYYIPKALKTYREQFQIFMNKNYWICYEGKNVIKGLVNQFGIEINMCNTKFLDVKVGGSLLDPDNPINNFTELQKVLGFVAEFTIATECRLQKTAWYLAVLRSCWQRLRQALLDQGLWKVFEDIEMRVLPIIAEMERVGVCVNMEKLRAMEGLLSGRLRAAEQACHRAAGRVFQLSSPQQLRAILYDELRLDSHCNVKIRETICNGAKSTSEAMLRSLMNKHPLPKLILEYRHLHKAHSTFLLGIAQCVHDGVVTPVWEQSAAATGRIACHTPNLQAVPKTLFSLTLFPEDGSGHEEEGLNLRSVYESREGWRLVAADFRQVECRVLALAAGDTALLAALRSPDLFTLLAATWLGKQEAAVSGEERERTKRVVYATMYGAGANKLADVLGLGYERALEVAASFNRTFPSLRRFGREVVARCEQDGKLRTPCGRLRHFRDIASTQAAARAQAERRAINFIIQGSAADVCKMAMVSSVAALAGRSPPLRARLLLQIHDELVWEVHHQHLHEAAAVIKRAMEGCGFGCGVAAALPVLLRCGQNWGEMEDFDPHTEIELL